FVENAPDRALADVIVKHLASQGTLARQLTGERVDMGVVERIVRLTGMETTAVLLQSAEETADAKRRERLYELVVQFGPAAVSPTARRLTEASQGGGRAAAQRELLAVLGRLLTPEMPLPAEIDLRRFLKHDDVQVRREAVKLLLRSAKREEAMLAGLADSDGRIVYLALTAAHERCPREGLMLVRGRVERGELDASLRALGIRAVATLRTPDTLKWLIERVVTRS